VFFFLNAGTWVLPEHFILENFNGCGFSGIRLPHSFVKLCADGLKLPLLHIFKLSLTTGTFPSKWKDSFFIPIVKTGNRNDVGNYLGVAILSCFAKLSAQHGQLNCDH
jgi:hypothetical protein